jgi:hypothetical protein
MDVLKTRRILYGRAGEMAIGKGNGQNGFATEPTEEHGRKRLKDFFSHEIHENHEIKKPITYYL